MNESVICRKALQTYGEESQKRMAIEECAELINALTKESRGRTSAEDIITEIADVQIMCEQLAQLYGRDAVTRERYRKLRRLETRIRKTIKSKGGLFDEDTNT